MDTYPLSPFDLPDMTLTLLCKLLTTYPFSSPRPTLITLSLEIYSLRTTVHSLKLDPPDPYIVFLVLFHRRNLVHDYPLDSQTVVIPLRPRDHRPLLSCRHLRSILIPLSNVSVILVLETRFDGHNEVKR